MINRSVDRDQEQWEGGGSRALLEQEFSRFGTGNKKWFIFWAHQLILISFHHQTTGTWQFNVEPDLYRLKTLARSQQQCCCAAVTLWVKEVSKEARLIFLFQCTLWTFFVPKAAAIYVLILSENFAVFDDFEKGVALQKFAGKWRKPYNCYYYFNGHFWNQKCS